MENVRDAMSPKADVDNVNRPPVKGTGLDCLEGVPIAGILGMCMCVCVYT